MSKEKVLETLASADKPLKAVQVCERTGLERAEVDKAFKELKKEGLIESPKPCFYTVAGK